MSTDRAPQLPAGIDLEMVAVDMSEMFAKWGHPIEVCSDDILPELRPFLLAILANAAASEQKEQEVAAADPGPRTEQGPAPEMTYLPWFESQGVEIGACGVHEHYWRCPLCPTWSGPYENGLEAKRPGMDHRWDAHDREKTLRSETAKAVRKATRNEILIARYDELVVELGERHGLDRITVHQFVGRVARAINHYSRTSDLLFALTRQGPMLSEEHARTIAADVATELGHDGWLDRGAQ